MITERMEQWPQEIDPFTTWLRSRQPRNVVEIGVRHGGTAALWCTIATGRVVGVDWTGADSLGNGHVQRLAESMTTKYSNYTFVLGDSHDVMTLQRVVDALNGELIDLLFLDGDHSYEGARQDLELYGPLVRPGGVIAFHDIVDSEFIRTFGHGVYRVWRELTGEKIEFCVNAEWGGIGAVVV